MTESQQRFFSRLDHLGSGKRSFAMRRVWRGTVKEGNDVSG